MPAAVTESAAWAKHNLGMARLVAGDLAKATALLERAYLIKRELFGEDHPETVLSRRNFECVSAG